jgi:tetratricopeptide (TPR) repeat protein
MPGLRKLALAASALALTQLTGACTHLEQMETDFAQTWETPPVEVNPSEPVVAAAMTEGSFAELEKKLAGLSADKECRSIVRISARMLSFKAGFAPAEQKWAECDYHDRDYAGARIRYLRIVESQPSMAAHLGLGLSEFRLGNSEEARKYLQLAAENADSPSWEAANVLGFLDDQDQQWEGAEKHYLKAAELAPRDGSALNNLGMSYMRQQRYADAATAFSRSIQAQPGLQVARLNLRIAQAMAGRTATALSGASEQDKAVVMNSLGVAALAGGDSGAAKTYFEAALNLSPSFYSNAYSNLELAAAASK